MTPGRIDPDSDQSDRLAEAVRPVRIVQFELVVVFQHEINLSFDS
jgi:hypothetical protein